VGQRRRARSHETAEAGIEKFAVLVVSPKNTILRCHVVKKNVNTPLTMDTLTKTDDVAEALEEFRKCDEEFAAAVRTLATYKSEHADLRTTIMGVMPVRIGANPALSQLENETAAALRNRNAALLRWSDLATAAEKHGG
jgi:hypothetical protein